MILEMILERMMLGQQEYSCKSACKLDFPAYYAANLSRWSLSVLCARPSRRHSKDNAASDFRHNVLQHLGNKDR